MRMQGRVALIVGAASGIGRASAEACANEGAAVVVADIDDARGGEVIDGIRAMGGSAIFAKVDITDEATVAAAVATAVREFGKLDALVTSAGGSPRGNERWHESVEMFLKGPYYACKHAVDVMVDAGGGAIVNVASIAGVVGGIGEGIDDSGYASAKHGVVGLSKTMALQYAKRNVRVNALCPGYIRTELTRRFHGSADGGDALINEQLRVPMGRWGEPEELGKVAAFLLSDDASYLTGQAIVVDGGFTAR